MRILFLCAASLGFTVATAQNKTTAKPAIKSPAKTSVATTANSLKNSKDSAGYALGVRLLQDLQSQGLDGVNLAMMQKAMNDVLQKKKLLIAEESLNNCIVSFITERNKIKMAEAEAEMSLAKKAAKDFLDANGKRTGVVTLPSGLQYEVIKDNPNGEKPTATDKVKCHYHGTLIDGTIFDSSVERGEPVDFPVNGVITGWQEALQLMTVGSKWKLYIPSSLAYGDQGTGGKIGPGAALVFEVELLSIEK